MTGFAKLLGNRFSQPISAEARIRLARMTETFLAEIGVLVAVFPALDSFIATGHLSLRIIVYSFAGSLVFYAMAATFAVLIGE